MSIKLLKQKDFSLLILGRVVSLLGSNIQQFALSLYVFALTESTLIFSTILAISIIPRLLLSPIAGVFGDWFDRKRAIVILDILNAIMIGIFAVDFIIYGKLTILAIYILVILLEASEIFFGSAMSAVIPSIVKKEELLEANSFNTLAMNIGDLIAPVIAALVFGLFGLKIVLIINAISFLLSAISEMFIKIPKHNKKPDKINLQAFFKDFVGGLKVIKENKSIRTLISLGTIINFSISPLFSIGLILIIKEILEASDFQFGLFQMVFSSSMILAPILCSGIIKKAKIGKLSYVSFILISILVLLMSIVPSDLILDHFIPNIFPYILLLVIIFIIGITVTISNIAVGTMFNQIVPLEYMGRTATALRLLVTIMIPIGQIFFGFLFDTIAASYVIIISGAILIIATFTYKKALFKIDSENSAEEENIEEQILSETGGELVNEI